MASEPDSMGVNPDAIKDQLGDLCKGLDLAKPQIFLSVTWGW